MIDQSSYIICINKNNNLVSIIRGSAKIKDNYVQLTNSIGNTFHFSEEHDAINFVACNLVPLNLDTSSSYYFKIKEKIDLINMSRKHFKLDISRNDLKYTFMGR